VKENARQFHSFMEFYPYYLSEHSNQTCRRLHYLATAGVIAVILYVLLSSDYEYVLILPIVGYLPSWIGHFAYEKNRPASFQYPFYSMLASWTMLTDMLKGDLRF